ncbi:diguanylate cyclase [Roseibium sp. RKSG952]|uniref:diguanylate cyclase n=1 Tax=Roseibium sp. RKSG952 TaxID=2529384 RepID=UPI0012BC1283|nr:diguanylate cyclase [Roseibium sp. RKSG952]MTH95177.1 diguanylate cyclase [Roseibium sp. RKSG952]
MTIAGLQTCIPLDLKQSFDHCEECVIFLSDDHCIRYANPPLTRLLGYPPDEVIGKQHNLLFEAGTSASDPDPGTNLLQDTPRPAMPGARLVRLVQKNGRALVADMFTTELVDAASNRAGFLAIIRPASGAALNDNREADLSEILKDALESISEGFALYDKSDRLVVCNAMYRSIYPKSADYMVPGTSFADILRAGLQDGEYDLQGLTAEEWLAERLHRHETADGSIIEQKLGDGRWLNIAERKTHSGGTAGIRTDITQLKNTEAQLARSNEDLVRLANTLPSNIVEVDRDGICILANDVACEWFARDRSALLGKRIRDLLPQEVRAHSARHFQRALAGETVRFETAIVYPDGKARHVKVEYLPKFDLEGVVDTVVACVTDISDVKKAEASIAEAYQNLTLLANTLSCSICEIDTNGNCTFINEIGAQWLGDTPENLLGTKLQSRLHYDIQPIVEDFVKRCLGGEVVRRELKVPFPDKTRRFVETEFMPKRNQAGTVIGLIALSMDITARKRAEKTLAELYTITSTRELSHDQKIDQILKLGCHHFGLPFGIISRIEGSSYEVVRAECPNGEIQAGARFDLDNTYCEITLGADGPLAISRMSSSGHETHPCYSAFGLETYIGAPVIVDGERYGTINFTSPDPRDREFTRNDSEIVRQFAEWVGHEIARQQDQDALLEAYTSLERISNTDDLTGILNRRAFMQRANTELKRSRKTRQKLAVLMMDIDHFKSINDTYGHPAGDDVILKFADLVKACLRTTDVFGRVGGEEFCAVLRCSGRGEALQVAERILQKIQSDCAMPPIDRPITCSIGLSFKRQDDFDFASLLKRADAALYQAKEQGRNRCIAESTLPETPSESRAMNS